MCMWHVIPSEVSSLICGFRNLKMDKVLKNIEQNFIALPYEEVEANNLVLNEILDTIISKMKTKSPLFTSLFLKKFYGGSYWDGVKVSKPDEYDVYIKCRLPYREVLKPSNKPGWINLKFTRERNPSKKKNQRSKPYYGIEGMHVLVNQEDYLDTEKVMLWFHQTLSCALGGKKNNKRRYCTLQTSYGIFDLVFLRHGSAFTFHASGIVNEVAVEIDLDFIPCFVFGNDQYPANGFLPNPCPERGIFIVPKQPAKGNSRSFMTDDTRFRYWRISFQAQESDLIRGKGNLKPALKLMQKLRNKRKHTCIATYFIKNIFLSHLYEPEPFWSRPLSSVFSTMLVYYKDCIDRGSISSYWYPADNLISHIKPEDLEIVSRDLEKVISDFQNHPDSRNVIAKCFLTRGEFKKFKNQK